MWDRTAAQLTSARIGYIARFCAREPHAPATAAAALRPRFHMCPSGSCRGRTCAHVPPDRCMECGNCDPGWRRASCGGINGDAINVY